MTRTVLPNRRRSAIVDFEHHGVRYTAQFSKIEGVLMEMFINAGREGTTADIIGRECAVILSIALQHGTPLNVIAQALPRLADGSPAGPVGKALVLAENDSSTE